uniref:Uncharacterized protein n=1 Tax=Avena sativa TaxID=4498 RepID=A0ACD5X0T5_AVESA
MANQLDEQGRSGVSDSLLEMAPLVRQLRGQLDTLSSFQAQPEDDGGPPPPRIIVAKVRDLTRNVASSEYDPDHVSIGPYNYPRPESKTPRLAKQRDKLTSLRAVLSAAKPGMTVESYVNELTRLEPQARSCYENTFDDLTRDDFVRMLLLDGCYILNRFVRLRVRARSITDDDVGTASNGSRSSSTTSADVGLAANGSSSTASDDVATAANGGSTTARGAAALEALAVVRDVFFLAENQIPFFVLEKIGELTNLVGEDSASTWIAEHALDLMSRQEYAKAAPAMVPHWPGNLLHLLHMHLKPNDALLRGAADRSASSGRWRTATEYSYAGVKFMSRAMSETRSVRCILDVNLDGGTLEVPQLDIDNETWRLLRNLMALEQRNGVTIGSYVTAYCVFMSQLAGTPRDVELLSKRRIIVHAHGNDDEVAKCFADLCKGIVFNIGDPAVNYLWNTRQKLDKRSRSYRRRWMAWLRRKYFSNPWLFVGLLAAAVGLLCAVVQSVYSVLSYYEQGQN